MTIEKLLSELQERVRNEYNELKATISFDQHVVEESCKRLIVIKTFVDYIESDLEDGLLEVPALLIFEKPTEDFYAWYVENDIDTMLDFDYEVLDDFFVYTINRAKEIVATPEKYDTKTVERALQYQGIIEEGRKKYEDN